MLTKQRISYLFVLVLFFHLSPTLFADSRDRIHQPEKVMDLAGVEPGMVIGEVGAGEGYFTFKLSGRVGENGKIYANDIVERVLRSVRRRCERDGITNIETIVGEVDDPLFPEVALDRVFIVNAFHDLARPAGACLDAGRGSGEDWRVQIRTGTYGDISPTAQHLHHKTEESVGRRSQKAQPEATCQVAAPGVDAVQVFTVWSIS